MFKKLESDPSKPKKKKSRLMFEMKRPDESIEEFKARCEAKHGIATIKPEEMDEEDLKAFKSMIAKEMGEENATLFQKIRNKMWS